MRTLVILRGVSGSGKSNFIREQELEDYTISSDKIRLQYSAPELNQDGRMVISQQHDKRVWAHIFDLLDCRMSQGEFTVVDATNLDPKTLKRYKQMKRQYGYKVVMVDFFIELEEALESNEKRKHSIDYVPINVIKRQHNKYMTSKIPHGLVDDYYTSSELGMFSNSLKNELEDSLWHNLKDYKKIHHIGDIHGCRDSLLTYLVGGKLKSDEFYIFVGDYTDRGIQNAETISYLTSIRDEPNVVFLEGNHDKRLIRFSKGRNSMSDEHTQFQPTKEALELAILNGQLGLDEIREWTSKFREVFFYKYNGSMVIVSHGGISNIPTSNGTTFFTGISSEEYIDGSGSRSFDVDYEFSQQMALKYEATEFNLKFNQFIQIHGHRNKFKLAIDQYLSSYNLEGRVEFGEYLRVLTIKKDADDIQIESHYVANNTFVSEIPRETIEKKEHVNIVGFNGKDNVVRGYEKLKEINLDKGAHLTNLAKELVFPVIGYQAYDGDIVYMYMSLGDLTVKAYGKNDMFEVEEKFSQLSLANFNTKQIEFIEGFIKENNVTLAFMLLDNSFGGIVNYDKPKIVLLDAIKNDSGLLGKMSDMEVQALTHEVSDLGNTLEYKQLSFISKNWTSFLSLYRAIKNDNGTLNGKGFIIEDSNNKSFLIKNNSYRLLELERDNKNYYFDTNDFVDTSKSVLNSYEDSSDKPEDA